MASISSELLAASARLGLEPSDLVPYGRDAAKVDPGVRTRPRRSVRDPKLILVSAITPTPAGEGKTTTSIGLGDALARLGESVCIALREPSQGPCFGAKGGGTGGGASQLVPADRINLHFTGDFHAIASAHNLLAALLDNHLQHGDALGLDPRRVLWRRVLDLNDRALREIVCGLGGAANGVPRESGFDITAASEVMAMLCLAEDEADLRVRLERTIVGFRRDGRPVTAADLGAPGAMLALLRDTLWPNLVRTAEGTPALVHGGPFANIAHGCSSVIATKLALHLADYVLTEAGFGFDQGAEKFFDLKCASAGLDTAAVVLVATVRALRLHGGRALRELSTPDPAAVGRGLANLEKHVENIRTFGESPIVALNLHEGDTAEEIEVVRSACLGLGVPFAVSDHFAKGGRGALELARTVVSHAESRSSPFRPLYAPGDPPTHKIRTVARRMYGARNVLFTKAAEHDLAEVERLGLSALPVCIAKTHSSLTDDPKIYGRPRDFDLTVRSVQINAGAGFLVVLTGEILRMPGLPKRPLAEHIDLRDGVITGLA